MEARGRRRDGSCAQLLLPVYAQGRQAIEQVSLVFFRQLQIQGLNLVQGILASGWLSDWRHFLAVRAPLMRTDVLLVKGSATHFAFDDLRHLAPLPRKAFHCDAKPKSRQANGKGG